MPSPTPLPHPQAQLPTRRFFNTLLDDHHFVVRCSMAALASRDPEGYLFSQLLERLRFYAGFEINDQTGDYPLRPQGVADDYAPSYGVVGNLASSQRCG